MRETDGYTHVRSLLVEAGSRKFPYTKGRVSVFSFLVLADSVTLPLIDLVAFFLFLLFFVCFFHVFFYFFV